MNTDTIKAGDFLIIGFGNGTQGVKVISTTAKRLEIIRCQQYLSDAPFWTGAISKISRTDKRIQQVWAVPQQVAADAPSDADIAETKEIAAHRAACSKLENKADKPFRAELESTETDSEGNYLLNTLRGEERAAFLAARSELESRRTAAYAAVIAAYAAEHGRNQYGKLIG